MAKETQSALSKALAELTFLETSFEESDFETSQQRKQARKEAQKQAEVAVQDALDAVGAAARKAQASDATSANQVGCLILPGLLVSTCHLCFGYHGGCFLALLMRPRHPVVRLLCCLQR